MAMSRFISSLVIPTESELDTLEPETPETPEVKAAKEEARKVMQAKLAKLEALASLSGQFAIDGTEKRALAETVSAALRKGEKKLGRLKALVDTSKRNLLIPEKKKELEELEEDPAQARLNLQLALDRLVSDESVQTLARTDGIKFQTRYNLTNDQMLTLCRLAVDVGAYKNTADLNEYMDAFKDLDPTLKGLSPGALAKLGIPATETDGLIGSCSCCCP